MSRARLAFRDVDFEGLAAVEVCHGGARLVVVHEVGPRIAWFGSEGGPNLLFWDRAGTYARGAFRLRGGHRVWVTRPLADESEETYAADNAPCRLERGEGWVTAVAPRDAHGLERSIAVRLSESGHFVVDSSVRNAGDMLWSGGVWALTCTLPGSATTYGVPLGQPRGDAAWDAFRIVIPRRWGGTHTSLVNDPQIAFTESCLVVTPRGRECKRMIEAPQGTIGMTDGKAGVSFVKTAAFHPDARYPLGTNIAFYVGPENFMVEMETMGAIKTLMPGETLAHEETWWLGPPVDWMSHASSAPSKTPALDHPQP